MTERTAVELDYAFLAQWARVNADGTLTAIDASFLRAAVPLGATMSLALAARLRFVGGRTDCHFAVEIAPPGGPDLRFNAQIDATDAPSYGSEPRRHMLVALNTGLVVQAHGKVTVRVILDDSLARELAFEVETLRDPESIEG